VRDSLTLPLIPSARAWRVPATKNLLFVLALLVWPFANAQEFEASEYPFKIERIRSSRNIRFVAVNSGPATLSVFFGIDGNDFNSDKKLPLTLVIGPNSTLDIVRITPAKHLKPIDISYRYSLHPGNVFMLPDRHARYRLPFAKNTPFLVVQEPGGTLTTHNDNHHRYAIDLAVPEGTLVTAAREGIVIGARDTCTEGRPDPSLSDKSNFVAIMHTDRSIAYYLHLAPRRVLVKPGQQVRAGAAIAYSGNTGYTHGPHLHFDVRRAIVTKKGEVTYRSVPVDFYPRSKAGKKIVLRQGMQLKAQ